MKTIKLIALSLLIVGCQHRPVRFPSSESKLTPKMGSENLKAIENKHILIVTHATSFYDKEKMAASGIDEIVKKFKAKNLPVVYLVDDQSAEGYQQWYTSDRSPDYEFYSEGGEHNLPIGANEVTIIGGFFGSTDTLNGCHALSVKDAIRMHFEVSSKPLTIHIPIKATYFYDEWINLRNSLLEKGYADLSAYDIKYPFASVYFLREDPEGLGDSGNEEIFAHYYTGSENKNYRRGEDVTKEKYQFDFYVNGKLFESVNGTGKRVVKIKIETH